MKKEEFEKLGIKKGDLFFVKESDAGIHSVGIFEKFEKMDHLPGEKFCVITKEGVSYDSSWEFFKKIKSKEEIVAFVNTLLFLLRKIRASNNASNNEMNKGIDAELNLFFS